MLDSLLPVAAALCDLEASVVAWLMMDCSRRVSRQHGGWWGALIPTGPTRISQKDGSHGTVAAHAEEAPGQRPASLDRPVVQDQVAAAFPHKVAHRPKVHRRLQDLDRAITRRDESAKVSKRRSPHLSLWL